MATFQGRGGELILNGKSLGVAEWSLNQSEPSETKAVVIPPIMGGTFTGHLAYLGLPCQYTFTLPSGFQGTFKGIINLVAMRAYLYVEPFEVYVLVHVTHEPTREEPKRRGIQFAAMATDLEAAKKWIKGE